MVVIVKWRRYICKSYYALFLTDFQQWFEYRRTVAPSTA
nr:SusD/RagB family nutrient-binding outer membrane lipoprotein [Pedobacter sp. SL55]